MEKKLKIGIIGTGSISESHIHAYRKNPNVEVYAFCDIRKDRLKEMGEKYGVTRLYTDKDVMLRELPELDAVSVCTWNSQHAPCTIAALKAGKHVLCEKSLVRSAHEALTVCSLAKQKNLFLMEAMWTRFLPKTITAKQWIREGRIGKVKLMQATIGWKADPVYNKRLFDPALGGGSLYDLGIYPLEVLPYLVDEKILDMEAFVTRHSTGVDDLVSMNLQLESCIANLQCSFTTKMPEDAYIYGEDGYIRLPKMHFGSRAELYNSADECIDSFDSGEENGFVYEVAEVVRCIENGLLESPICPHQMTIDAARITSEVLHLNP